MGPHDRHRLPEGERSVDYLAPTVADGEAGFGGAQLASETTIASFQKELAGMGYKFQFITLAGFHALSASVFELAHGKPPRA